MNPTLLNKGQIWEELGLEGNNKIIIINVLKQNTEGIRGNIQDAIKREDTSLARLGVILLFFILLTFFSFFSNLLRTTTSFEIT